MDRRKARWNPDLKISATFLHFAEPILGDLPSDAPEKHARHALRLAFLAWNAVIFADVLNDEGHINEIRRLTVDMPAASLLMERLIARKRALFADDERLIGDWKVTRTPDGINLRAEARDPYSLRRNLP
jgi:hypothetical protein